MFMEMFDHRGKTTRVIGEPRIKIYRELFEHITNLQEEGELPTHDDYLGGNELAQNIYNKKIITSKTIND